VPSAIIRFVSGFVILQEVSPGQSSVIICNPSSPKPGPQFCAFIKKAENKRRDESNSFFIVFVLGISKVRKSVG
jgi:hypothetical protein